MRERSALIAIVGGFEVVLDGRSQLSVRPWIFGQRLRLRGLREFVQVQVAGSVDAGVAVGQRDAERRLAFFDVFQHLREARTRSEGEGSLFFHVLSTSARPAAVRLGALAAAPRRPTGPGDPTVDRLRHPAMASAYSSPCRFRCRFWSHSLNALASSTSAQAVLLLGAGPPVWSAIKARHFLCLLSLFQLLVFPDWARHFHWTVLCASLTWPAWEAGSTFVGLRLDKPMGWIQRSTCMVQLVHLCRDGILTNMKPAIWMLDSGYGTNYAQMGRRRLTTQSGSISLSCEGRRFGFGYGMVQRATQERRCWLVFGQNGLRSSCDLEISQHHWIDFRLKKPCERRGRKWHDHIWTLWKKGSISRGSAFSFVRSWKEQIMHITWRGSCFRTGCMMSGSMPVKTKAWMVMGAKVLPHQMAYGEVALTCKTRPMKMCAADESYVWWPYSCRSTHVPQCKQRKARIRMHVGFCVLYPGLCTRGLRHMVDAPCVRVDRASRQCCDVSGWRSVVQQKTSLFLQCIFRRCLFSVCIWHSVRLTHHAAVFFVRVASLHIPAPMRLCLRHVRDAAACLRKVASLPLSCLPGLQSPCPIVPQPMCEPVRSQFRTRQPSMSRLQTFVPSSFSFADYSLHRTSCLRCEGCYSTHGGS